MGYDLQGAIEAGVPESEIAAHLKSKYQYDYTAARSAGVGVEDIAAHVNSKTLPAGPQMPSPVTVPQAPTTPENPHAGLMSKPLDEALVAGMAKHIPPFLSKFMEPEQTFYVPKSPMALLQMTGGMLRKDAIAAGLLKKVTGPPHQMMAKGMLEYILEPGVPLLGQKMGRGKALISLDKKIPPLPPPPPKFIDSDKYAEIMARMSDQFENPVLPASLEDYIPKSGPVYPPGSPANRALREAAKVASPTRTKQEASALQEILSQPKRIESIPKLAGEAVRPTPKVLHSAEDLLRPRTAAAERLGPLAATPGPPKRLSKAFIKRTEKLLKKPGHLLTAEDLVDIKVLGQGGHYTVPEHTEIFSIGGVPKKVRDAVEGFFRPQSLMKDGEEFLAIRGKHLGVQDKIEEFVEKLITPTKKWPQEIKKAAYRAAIEEVPMSSLPGYAQKPVRDIRRALRHAGKSLVKQGRMTEKTFAKLEGKYLKRLYLKHILPEKAFKGGGGGANTGFLKPRYDLTKAEQEARGLIEDISVSGAHSLTNELTSIENHAYFGELSKHPEFVHPNSFADMPGVSGGVKRVPLGELDDTLETYGKIIQHDPTNAPAKAFYDKLQKSRASVKVSDIPKDFVPLKGKKYGPLNGAYVHKTIQRDIQSLHITPSGEGTKIVNAIKKINDVTMTTFKVSKTALNVPTMGVNAVSGAGQMLMGGMSPRRIAKYYIKAVREYVKKGVAYRQMARRGAFRGNFHTGELNEVMSQFKKLPSEPSIGDIFSAFSGLTKFYGKIDDVSKLAFFMHTKDHGMPFSLVKRAPFKGTFIDEAAKEAIEWGMDYSFAHPGIKIARRWSVPFVTFKYKAAPLVVKSLKARPWVIAAMAALPYAITQAGKQYRNLSDKDWEGLRHDLPSFIRKSKTYTFFPFKDKKGNWGWVDLQKFMPWGDLQRMGQSAIDKDVGGLYQNTGIGNPFLTLATTLATARGDKSLVDPFTKKTIYYAADTPGNKMLKTMEWAFTHMAPGMLTRRGALGVTANALSDTPNKYGSIPPVGEAVARFGGVNINHPDSVQATRERKGRVREAKGDLRRLLNDPRNKGDIPYREKARAKTRKKIQDILNDR